MTLQLSICKQHTLRFGDTQDAHICGVCSLRVPVLGRLKGKLKGTPPPFWGSPEKLLWPSLHLALEIVSDWLSVSAPTNDPKWPQSHTGKASHLLRPIDPLSGKLFTFYVYRAQGKTSYPPENVNVADLGGVMWCLGQLLKFHNRLFWHFAPPPLECAGSEPGPRCSEQKLGEL